MRAHSAVKIRVATADDGAAIIALIEQLQDAERAADPDLPPGCTMAAAYFGETLEACRAYAGALLVAERGAEVHGFASVLARVPREGADEPARSYALLRDLVVRRDVRGAGVGRLLLDAVMAYARQHGASELRVDALAQNTAAHTFYARVGFEPYLVTRRLKLDGVAP